MPTLPQSAATWGHLGIFNATQFTQFNPAGYVGKQLGVDDGAGTVTQYISNGQTWQPLGGLGAVVPPNGQDLTFSTNVGPGSAALYINNWLPVVVSGVTCYIPVFGTSPTPPPPDPSPLRPKWFLGPADAFETGTQGYLDGATFLSNSAANGKAGNFTLTTTDGNYGWLAVTSAVSADGVTFFDGVGYGGWSGAGQPGNYTNGDTVNTSTVLFTDSDSVSWRLFRQDYVNSNQIAAPWTTS